MKRLISFVLVLVMAACLAGCKVKIMDKEQPTTSPAQQQASQDAAAGYVCSEDIAYTVEQLQEIDQFMGNKREFFDAYPTPYVTEYDNGESRFLYYSETNVLAIYFDKKEARDMVYNDYFALSVPKAQMEQVQLWSTIEDVMELDPNGFYPFTGDYPTANHHSAHYTSDKYIFWIYYNTDYAVERIESEYVGK